MYGTVFVTHEECTYSYFDKCILYFRVLAVFLTLSKSSCVILGILQLVHYFRFLYSVILHAVELCLVCLLSSIWTYVLLPVKWLLHHSTHQPLFFNKDYTKSCAFVSFHWSAPGGYSDPERSRRSPASPECNPHQDLGPVHE